MKKINLLVVCLLLILTHPIKSKSASLNLSSEEKIKDSTLVDSIYFGVDVPAQYPGGINEAYNFIRQNLQYPDSSGYKRVEGRVISKFIIRKTGLIDSIQIIKGVNTELDNEAIRVIRSFPNWIPAQINGKDVSSYTVIPISFKLENEMKDSIHINRSLIYIPVILDSVQMPENFNILTINPDLIKSGNFITPYPKSVRDNLVEKYGDSAEDGVMIINTVKTPIHNPIKISETQCINNGDTIWTDTDKPAAFNEGSAKLNEFLKANIKYPSLALECNIQGYLEAYLTIDQFGKIKSIAFKSDENRILSDEVIRVIKMLPDWLPAQKNNKNVSAIITIPFSFTIAENREPNISFDKNLESNISQSNQPLIELDGEVLPNIFDISLIDISKIKGYEFQEHSQELIKNYGKDAENGLFKLFSVKNELQIETVMLIDSTNSINGERILDFAEQMPQFPGGEYALLKFLGRNMQYPVNALNNGITGSVLTRFVVDQYGNVQNVEAIRSTSPLFEPEAIRLLKSMPNWIPGKQNGKNVAVYFSVPISFKLQ